MMTLYFKNLIHVVLNKMVIELGHKSYVLCIVGYKVFIQASGLAYEVYVEVSSLRFLPTTVCEVADSVVCQVAMLPSFNSL